MAEYPLRGWRGVRGSEKASSLRAQQQDLFREVLFGTEAHDLPVGSESSTTGVYLGGMDEEKSGL